MEKTILPVTEIQRFCMHDGPGVRTTVFFKGCPLRCAWCHNPETQCAQNEILYYPQKCIGCGVCATACASNTHSITLNGHTFDREFCSACGKCADICPTGALESTPKYMSIKDILESVEKDLAFYGKDGGITLSGGEALIHGDKILHLLNACKEKSLNTAIETCGYFDGSMLTELAPLTDIILWDIKDTNDTRHIEYTGVSNKKILENLFLADQLGIKTVLRCIMVNGVNTNDAHLNAIADIWHNLKHSVYVELLTYHAFGGSKAIAIGRADNGKAEWIPSKDFISSAEKYLISKNVTVKEHK